MGNLLNRFTFFHGLKQVVVVCFAAFFVFPVFADNITTSPAGCNNTVLSTADGPATLTAQYRPNNIDIRWYDEGEQITGVASEASTCVYNQNFSLPSAPTKTGYVFDGWKILGLPSGYTRLEYLQSDGNSYIDTGFQPDTAGYKHTIVFEPISTSSGYLCGTGTSGRSGNVRVVNYTIDGIYNGTSSAVSILSGSSVALLRGTPNKLVLDLKQNAACSAVLNGTSISNSSTTTVNSSATLKLFTSSSTSVPFRIYYDIIEKNGVVIHHFIPAKNSSNVIGMYDIIQKEFRTKQGSGTFTAGQEMN